MISLDEKWSLAVTRQTRHFRSAGCSPPQTRAETRTRADSGCKLSSHSSRQPNFFFRREGALLLATRLLIGRTHRGIPWPSSIGQAHGRWGNSHPSGGVQIRGVCSSAYLLTSGHVRNGDGAESETGRVRRPLLADWPKRDAMPMLDSAHARAFAGERTKNATSSVVVLKRRWALLSLL